MVSKDTILYTVVEQSKDRINGFFSNFSEISINGEAIKSNTKAFGGIILSLFGGLLNFVLVLVFSFYLAIQDHGIENFLRIITPVKYTKYSLNL
jgi:predicted PurR-regulated permease PerM